ncbi:PAS domain-containing protein [Brevundimonas bullata]|uniref:PAS domain-containing protein n=1 Tax=Brevundimonas bullata TaxID=13160 RepID=UPI002FD9F2CF
MPDAAAPHTAFLRPMLELMAEHLGGAVILHSAPTGEILMAAGGVPGLAFDNAVGATAEDYVGRFAVYAQDGSVAKLEALPVVRAMATGQPVVDEVWLLGAGADPVPVFVDSYPLKDDSGAVIGVIATATDPKRWAMRAERLKRSSSLRDRFVRD